MKIRFLAYSIILVMIGCCRVGASDTASSHREFMKELFSSEQHGEVPLTPVIPVGGDITSEQGFGFETVGKNKDVNSKASQEKKPVQSPDKEQFDRLVKEFKNAQLEIRGADDASSQSPHGYLSTSESNSASK